MFQYCAEKSASLLFKDNIQTAQIPNSNEIDIFQPNLPAHVLDFLPFISRKIPHPLGIHLWKKQRKMENHLRYLPNWPNSQGEGAERSHAPDGLRLLQGSGRTCCFE